MTTRLVVLAYNEERGHRPRPRGTSTPSLPLDVIVVGRRQTDRTESIVRQMKQPFLSSSSPRGPTAASPPPSTPDSATPPPSPSRADFVITIEATAPNSLPALGPIISLLARANDVVCGSRYVPGGGYHGFPLGPPDLERGANLVMRWYCGLCPSRTTRSSTRGYRAELLQEAFRRYGRRFIEAQGFFANIEILVKLSRLPAAAGGRDSRGLRLRLEALGEQDARVAQPPASTCASSSATRVGPRNPAPDRPREAKRPRVAADPLVEPAPRQPEARSWPPASTRAALRMSLTYTFWSPGRQSS